MPKRVIPISENGIGNTHVKSRSFTNGDYQMARQRKTTDHDLGSAAIATVWLAFYLLAFATAGWSLVAPNGEKFAGNLKTSSPAQLDH